MNRQYAKIISQNRIGYAPDSIVIGSKVYTSPTAEQYEQCGYYPVVDTPQPDGLFWDYAWRMVDKKVTRVWLELPDTRTDAEKREYAYRTRLIIEYDDDILTVDEARNICSEYQFENTDRAKKIVDELSDKITKAKDAIREEYPKNDRKKKNKPSEPEKPTDPDEPPEKDNPDGEKK